MIWVPNQLIGASIGEEVTLECATEAFPLSLNYWTKEDSFMIVNSDKYKMSNSENSYKVHMKLTIKKVTAEDFGMGTIIVSLKLTTTNPLSFLCPGTYRCYAKNSLGSTQGSIRIYGEWRASGMDGQIRTVCLNWRACSEQRERINWRCRSIKTSQFERTLVPANGSEINEPR